MGKVSKRLMNKTYCKFPFNGFQVNAKGMRLCCFSPNFSNEQPSKFWNGKYIKSVRKNMNNGTNVVDCHSCYKKEIENSLSLRNHYNSKFKNINANNLPLVIDLDFSNFCNLKCIMCNPTRSSQWAKEIDPTVANNGVWKIDKNIINDLCKISNKLEYITIQGGEPSLIPEYNYYFDYLITNDISKNIELDCITNLTNINNKFFLQIQKFKKVNINVSLDSYGSHNDYIRYPSNFLQIEKNIHKLIDFDMQVNLQISLQTLSMFNFYEYLIWMNNVNNMFLNKNKKIGLNISKVDSPSIFNICTAPLKLKKHFVNDLEKFYKEFSPKFDVKFNLEIQRTKKSLFNTTKTNSKELLKFISNNDSKRNIKITDYIPNFYDYF